MYVSTGYYRRDPHHLLLHPVWNAEDYIRRCYFSSCTKYHRDWLQEACTKGWDRVLGQKYCGGVNYYCPIPIFQLIPLRTVVELLVSDFVFSLLPRDLFSYNVLYIKATAISISVPPGCIKGIMINCGTLVRGRKRKRK